MEKRRPHYDLVEVQARIVVLGGSAFTQTALRGGLDMGLTRAEMLAAVGALNASCFYKSMTTHHDHTVWQDVYHSPTPRGVAYVKITLVADTPIIQFKRR